MLPLQAKKELTALLGPRGYLDRPEDLSLYEYDGSIDKSRPDMVVFPRTTEDVVSIVKITRSHNIPVVGRGAGLHDERHRFRVDARGVNAPGPAVDDDIERVARAMHRHLAHAAIDLGFVLHGLNHCIGSS